MAVLGNGWVVGGDFCASQGDSWLGSEAETVASVLLLYLPPFPARVNISFLLSVALARVKTMHALPLCGAC